MPFKEDKRETGSARTSRRADPPDANQRAGHMALRIRHRE